VQQQLIGSIMVAFAIVAVTIAIVTAKLGPFAEDTDLREDRQERQEEQLEQQEERQEEQGEDNSGGGG
jgi:ribosomal protein L12E/L44/L45/RPP1/RPP2